MTMTMVCQTHDGVGVQVGDDLRNVGREEG